MSGKITYLWFTLNSAFEKLAFGYTWWSLLFNWKECIEIEVICTAAPNTEYVCKWDYVNCPLGFMLYDRAQNVKWRRKCQSGIRVVQNDGFLYVLYLFKVFLLKVFWKNKTKNIILKNLKLMCLTELPHMCSVKWYSHLFAVLATL